MSRIQIALASLVFPTAVLANDGIAAVGVGGIVFGKTDAIAMKKEVLSISNDQVSVDYEFLNESARDVEETIVFPLPPYPAAAQPSDTHYGQPNGFSILVDGKPVAFQSRLAALTKDGRDVTAVLKKLGLSDEQIANPNLFMSQYPRGPDLSEQQTQKLTKLGLFNEGWEGAAWMVKVDYVWKQKFSANKLVRVHHAYRPFAAAGSGSEMFDERFQQKFCPDQSFTAARARTIEGGGGLDGRDVSYILSTGNTWKRGIEDFTLNVAKHAPDELVSLCFPGTFRKIDALTFQVHLKHFKPTQDLHIHFANVHNGSHGNMGVMPVLPH